jgi:AcrR family transcriptional regulator
MSDNRREAIADAAIEIIALEGLRALTHRAIDARLDYPAGSTSYYLRTRQALIEAVVHRLCARTVQDVGASQSPALPSTSSEAARIVSKLILGMAEERPLDHLARFALRIDLIDEPELHKLISDESPVRTLLMSASEAMLKAIGVQEASVLAADLVALVDSLLFDQLTNGRAAAQPQRVLAAYLAGLLQQSGSA